MLTIGTMPIMLKIVGKLDIKPIIPMLKNLDIFEEPKDAEDAKDALKKLSKEKVGVLACEVLAEITPQLGKIADDLPPLVAAYKGISVAEAQKLDAAEVINELVNDEGVRSFFKRALRKKAGQETKHSYTNIMTGSLSRAYRLRLSVGCFLLQPRRKNGSKKPNRKKGFSPYGLQIMPLQSCKARRLWTTKRL